MNKQYNKDRFLLNLLTAKFLVLMMDHYVPESLSLTACKYPEKV
ncbi:hypothetical protein JL09_g6347 [Pichia kudriavzevii]|uniref:Uncharacterized protein n=1 Tax=Pichia kudriavzevii TaxID=4909 RepID=A0A099NRI9_PICKU|nr:hypothetical protein JL09_g6347 [Pichia kudriavzevii]